MPLQADLNRVPKKTIYQNPELDPTNRRRWWLCEHEDIYKEITMVTEEILTNLAVRRRMNYYFASLYNDTGASFMASRNVNLYYNRVALDGNATLNSSMTVNVLQNVIDSACSMIAKNKPKPQFITDGAKDYSTKIKGKKLTKYVEGVFDEMNIYQICQRVFTDSCIYGTGAVKIYQEDGKLKAENLFIEELLIDDLEGMHEKPAQIHQRKYIARDILTAQFPKYAEEIKGAQQVSGGSASFSTADIIPVIESWHLKSGKKEKDGVHSICIENCTLFSEQYDKDYYPIFFFRWAYQTLGFWGRGICHEIWKMQRELDIIYQTIQRCMRLVSGPVIAVESGSNIPESHLTSNKLVKILEYTAVEPKYLIPPVVQAELYEHADRIEDRMYKVTGVSQAQATGTKPKDVSSKVAIREVSDQATGRFEIVAQRWEDLFLDLARASVDMSGDLPEASVLITDEDGATRLDFKSVKSDLDDYKLQLFPISGLASTPAGRLDQLMDYAQAGYLTKEQVMDVVDFPDLKDTTSLETAALHLTQQILSNIKESGDYMSPGAYLDLPMAFRMVCLEIDRSTLQKVKPEYIELLKQWADEVKDLLDQSQSNQQTAPVQAAIQQPAPPQQTVMQAAPPAPAPAIGQ